MFEYLYSFFSKLLISRRKKEREIEGVETRHTKTKFYQHLRWTWTDRYRSVINVVWYLVQQNLLNSPSPSTTISNQPPSWNATNKISTIREAKSILYLDVRISQINTFSHRRVSPVSLNIINAIRRHLPVFHFVCVIERIVMLSISNYSLSLSPLLSRCMKTIER